MPRDSAVAQRRIGGVPANELLSKLADVGRYIEQSEQFVAEAKVERDGLIVALADLGWSEREIARAASVTAPRVHQIVEASR